VGQLGTKVERKCIKCGGIIKGKMNLDICLKCGKASLRQRALNELNRINSSKQTLISL
jgi:rRNA maturation endonuclease Nob1